MSTSSTDYTRFKPAHYPGLADKIVGITGAARGIGLALAQGFARHGAHLFLIDVDADALRDTSERLGTEHKDVAIETACISVADDVAVESAFARAESRFGRIDVMLNNAGISMNTPSLDLTPEQWRRTIDINLSGVFYCAQAAGRRMVRQKGGAIVNTASMAGLSPFKERAAYCAAKAGVIALTKVLAVEWAPHGVRVNAIAPGVANTELVKQLAASGRVNVEGVCRGTPLGRLGEPDEIAEAALFLASDSCVFVTGHTFVADGGWTADGLH